MKTKCPIFIHSLFRTGSTYVWNKFRQTQSFFCYYEPFHQAMAEVTPVDSKLFFTENYQLVGHPILGMGYLAEYDGLFRQHPEKGLMNFHKSFSFDLFCLEEPNPDLEHYVELLIRNAGNNIPLLQFNRSALRMGWFKRFFPDSLNIYIFRDPRDQFQSYVNMQTKTGDPIFFVMDLMAAMLNRGSRFFEPLSRVIPLIEYHHDSFGVERQFYEVVNAVIGSKDKYRVFYFLWFRSLMEGIMQSDVIININRLSMDPYYNGYIGEIISRLAGKKVDFKDSNITIYKDYDLPREVLDEIESDTRILVMSSLKRKQKRLIFKKILNERDGDFFLRLFRDPVRKKVSVKKKDIALETVAFYQKIIQELMDQYINKSDMLKERDIHLKKLYVQLETFRKDR